MKIPLTIALLSTLPMNHFSLAAIGYKNQGLLKPVNSKLFQALDIRMGAISTAENNKKAKITIAVLQCIFIFNL